VISIQTHGWLQVFAGHTSLRGQAEKALAVPSVDVTAWKDRLELLTNHPLLSPRSASVRESNGIDRWPVFKWSPLCSLLAQTITLNHREIMSDIDPQLGGSVLLQHIFTSISQAIEKRDNPVVVNLVMTRPCSGQQHRVLAKLSAAILELWYTFDEKPILKYSRSATSIYSVLPSATSKSRLIKADLLREDSDVEFDTWADFIEDEYRKHVTGEIPLCKLPEKRTVSTHQTTGETFLL